MNRAGNDLKIAIVLGILGFTLPYITVVFPLSHQLMVLVRGGRFFHEMSQFLHGSASGIIWVLLQVIGGPLAWTLLLATLLLESIGAITPQVRQLVAVLSAVCATLCFTAFVYLLLNGNYSHAPWASRTFIYGSLLHYLLAIVFYLSFVAALDPFRTGLTAVAAILLGVLTGITEIASIAQVLMLRRYFTPGSLFQVLTLIAVALQIVFFAIVANQIRKPKPAWA